MEDKLIAEYINNVVCNRYVRYPCPCGDVLHELRMLGVINE